LNWLLEQRDAPRISW
jgi:V-type H+-transporting ATPase subunit H